jgi:hypothetical protein
MTVSEARERAIAELQKENLSIQRD